MQTPITPKSTARKLRVAEAVNHLIVTLTVANKDFWNRSTDTILTELNLDIEESMELLTGNTTLATALNATQASLNVRNEDGNPVFTERAPVVPGRTDIIFEGSQFIFVPAVDPAPDPEITPE